MSIFEYTEDELENILVESDFKKFNASQIIDWIYKKKILDFNEMTNLSKSLINFCINFFNTNLLKCIQKEESETANKYLIELDDSHKIECVLMKQKYGNSLCISSQVGCNMGCAFCESGRLKKLRNLTCGEMISQILLIESLENIKINSVVVMGIGEPFDNYEEIIKFIKIATNPKMLELGQRKIAVSTCGLVPKIYEFADFDTQVNLAISLHAPFDSIRESIMPIAKAYPLEELLKSIDYYISKTNRKVAIEYIMIKDVNDSEECARELVKLLKGKLVLINLIPYNQTSNLTFKRSDNFQMMHFYDILKKNNMNVTIRREMGPDLSAACGQLRAESEV